MTEAVSAGAGEYRRPISLDGEEAPDDLEARRRERILRTATLSQAAINTLRHLDDELRQVAGAPPDRPARPRDTTNSTELDNAA